MIIILKNIELLVSKIFIIRARKFVHLKQNRIN